MRGEKNGVCMIFNTELHIKYVFIAHTLLSHL